mgnify:CR=1 FL=1
MRIDRIKLISEMAIQEIKVGELSEKAGVSRVTISAMRSGKSCTKNSAIHVARGNIEKAKAADAIRELSIKLQREVRERKASRQVTNELIRATI